MEEERKIILGLLESGVITKEEAFKLLDAIDNNENKKSGFLEEELKKLGVSLDRLGKKAKKSYKKYEPSINESANVLKKTAGALYKDFMKTVNPPRRHETKGNQSNDESDIFEHDDFVNKQ